MTAWTVVNRRGEFFTSEVNINSNLDVVFASTHNACVRPRSLLFAFLIFTEIIEFNPMLKFIFEFAWAIQRIRRFVTMREPLSPLFPFVSSTEFIESMTFSPLLQASRGGFESNLSSLSCQMYSTDFSFPFIALQFKVMRQMGSSAWEKLFSLQYWTELELWRNPLNKPWTLLGTQTTIESQQKSKGRSSPHFWCFNCTV